MLKRLIPIAVGLALAVSGPSLAQTPPTGSTGSTTGQSTGQSTTDSPPVRSVLPGRVGGGRQAPRGRQAAAARAPSPEEVKARASELVAGLKPDCQVTEAILLGNSAQGQAIYEAACATGPGYILLSAVAAAPPAEAIAASAADCVDLFGQADVARQRDPAVAVGIQCTLPANQDVLKVVSAYAKAAGVACTVDQGSATGVREGKTVYEVGCPGEDGYWVERAGAGWTATPCIEIKSMNSVCRYTTTAEQAATLKGWLAGSEAATCDVAESRYMGANANGSFFEAKCNGADGLIVRFDTAKAVQQIYPCATAQRIGGGCKLTEAPAAPAATEPAPPATRE